MPTRLSEAPARAAPAVASLIAASVRAQRSRAPLRPEMLEACRAWSHLLQSPAGGSVQLGFDAGPRDIEIGRGAPFRVQLPWLKSDQDWTEDAIARHLASVAA